VSLAGQWGSQSGPREAKEVFFFSFCFCFVTQEEKTQQHPRFIIVF
jgi:hypothetical protein